MQKFWRITERKHLFLFMALHFAVIDIVAVWKGFEKLLLAALQASTELKYRCMFGIACEEKKKDTKVEAFLLALLWLY